MNGIVYLILLDNQIVLQPCKEIFLILLRIIRTFILIFVYTFLTTQLVGHPQHGAPALLDVSISTTFLYRNDKFNLLSTCNLVG